MTDVFIKREKFGHTRKIHVKMIAETFGIYKQEMPTVVSKPPGARQEA